MLPSGACIVCWLLWIKFWSTNLSCELNREPGTPFPFWIFLWDLRYWKIGVTLPSTEVSKSLTGSCPIWLQCKLTYFICEAWLIFVMHILQKKKVLVIYTLARGSFYIRFLKNYAAEEAREPHYTVKMFMSWNITTQKYKSTKLNGESTKCNWYWHSS